MNKLTDGINITQTLVNICYEMERSLKKNIYKPNCKQTKVYIQFNENIKKLKG